LFAHAACFCRARPAALGLAHPAFPRLAVASLRPTLPYPGRLADAALRRLRAGPGLAAEATGFGDRMFHAVRARRRPRTRFFAAAAAAQLTRRRARLLCQAPPRPRCRAHERACGPGACASCSGAAQHVKRQLPGAPKFADAGWTPPQLCAAPTLPRACGCLLHDAHGSVHRRACRAPVRRTKVCGLRLASASSGAPGSCPRTC